MTSLLVHATGAQTTVQDLGRPGHASLGVPIGGAADRRSLQLANRLVGNETGPSRMPGDEQNRRSTPPEADRGAAGWATRGSAGAAALEVLLGGLEVEAQGPVVVAITGAPVGLTITRAGTTTAGAFGVSIGLRAGDRLRLGAPTHGLRSYLAVRGGFEAPLLLGSASASLAAGLGPAQVRVGDRLVVGSSALVAMPDVGVELVAGVSASVGDLALRAVLGPRHDWFTDEAVAALGASQWSLTSDADRVGVRLAGPVLTRRHHDELPSEPMVEGSIQVPPSGQPIIFGPDYPTTGGYPVIAVLARADLDAVFQCRPGDTVRFRLGRCHL